MSVHTTIIPSADSGPVLVRIWLQPGAMLKCPPTTGAIEPMKLTSEMTHSAALPGGWVAHTQCEWLGPSVHASALIGPPAVNCDAPPTLTVPSLVTTES